MTDALKGIHHVQEAIKDLKGKDLSPQLQAGIQQLQYAVVGLLGTEREARRLIPQKISEEDRRFIHEQLAKAEAGIRQAQKIVEEMDGSLSRAIVESRLRALEEIAENLRRGRIIPEDENFLQELRREIRESLKTVDRERSRLVDESLSFPVIYLGTCRKVLLKYANAA